MTEQDATEHLLKEGRPPSSIHFVGNVMIDSLRHFLPVAQQSSIGHDLELVQGEEWRRFAVLTLSIVLRTSDATDTLAELLGAIAAIADEVPVIFPVHPRTRERLAQLGLTHRQNLRLIQPLGYLDFLCLLSRATLVLTDSGGIQEETTALGVPCLTLRENTERPITISKGTNLLVGTNPSKIVAAARDVLSGNSKAGRIPATLGWQGSRAHRRHPFASCAQARTHRCWRVVSHCFAAA